MERSIFDPVSKTLTITEGFQKKMQDVESKEFQYYSKMMASIPGLKVVHRTHKTPRSYTTKDGQVFACNPGKNLKYQNMENFIAGLPNAEQYMREYNFLRECAADLQTSRHNLVKKWFLAQFPNFRTNPLVYLNQVPTPINAKEFVAGFATDCVVGQSATAGVVQ